MSKYFGGKYSRKLGKKLGKSLGKQLVKGLKSDFSKDLGKQIGKGVSNKLSELQSWKSDTKTRPETKPKSSQKTNIDKRKTRRVETARPNIKLSAGWGSTLLYIVPIPLIFRAFFNEPLGLALNLLAFGVLMLAAKLTRDGIRAHKAYAARRVARRPAIPRKVFGSFLTGSGLFIAGFADGGELLNPLILGGVGFALHSFAFGLDPFRSKGMEGVDTFQNQRVARVVDEAEKHLEAMSTAMTRIRDREIQQCLAHFLDVVRHMLRTVEEDPRDLNPARKYLGVYLLGARDATLKFVDLYSQTRDQKVREDYVGLLADLEFNFAAKTEKLLLDDRSDLDVEIEVLRERLQRDSVHLGK
ncbi:MAG TPA: hypothetical protein DD729_00425 [Rhodobacteraceae bacterium]|jgi:hypothetical protein|nr:hypothetical protein [Paracoccaceae bacterium]